MPRKSTTADTLKHQAATDSDLEPLPDFTMPAQNGHVPEGVRPSERCGTPSTQGWNAGSNCTFKEFHAGRHSWQPEGDTSTEPAHADQPALPGTPEPEFNEYSVPVESAFEGKDFMSAPGLRAIADAWISETEELAHLRGIPIRYFWKRRGGLKGGNPRLGNLQKPSGIVRYSLGHPTLLMWVAADHVRDLKLDHDKIRAAVLHELCKASPDPDDHSAYRVVGPDAEVFTLELQKCGLWSMDLREVGAHVKQLGLLDTLMLEPDQVADENEDDEADG
jgi:hypothetical protein